jgi:hypothetical protein
MLLLTAVPSHRLRKDMNHRCTQMHTDSLGEIDSSGSRFGQVVKFRQITPKRRKELPAELAAFAKRVENKVREIIMLEFDAAPKEVGSAWNAGEYDNATWKARVLSTNSALGVF